MTHAFPSHRPVLPALLVLSAALIAGCSSDKPVAREEIGAGKTSVETMSASMSGSDMSVPELATARSKLEQAQAAERAHQWEKARLLAEEADLDAKVARAKLTSDKSRKAAAELDASLATLREELNRQSSATTGAPVKP